MLIIILQYRFCIFFLLDYKLMVSIYFYCYVSELTYDELVLVIKKVGFDIEKVDYGLESPYLDNQNNLLSYNYKTPLLVALKPGVTPQL